MRELRDPVHGFIHRQRKEESVIDTPIFQRLRRIKQLAMASLVYPGAMHTRFEHSIGVMHLAGRMAERLNIIPDSGDKENLCLAALLHDLGHGPFSHVSEDILDEFYDREKISLAEGEKVHEKVTWELIAHSPDLEPYISSEDRKVIIEMLSGKWNDQVFKDILSGPVDADKQDYLLRDSYFCGVKYGVYDIERLLEVLEVGDDGGDKFLAVSSDGVHVLEQFVLAKYYMTTQVYRHKVRLISDSMITRAIELGIRKDKIEELIHLYTFDGSENFFKEWVLWDDETLTTLLRRLNGYAGRLFRDLVHRKLFKRVFNSKLVDFRPVTRQNLSEGFKQFAREIERQIGNLIEIDPELVIAKKFTIQSVREQSRNSVGPIIVQGTTGPVSFEEESMLFRSINAAEKDEFLEVYAPVQFRDDREKRRRLKDYDERIKGIIEEVAGAAFGYK